MKEKDKKLRYSIQLVVILAIFSFVLFNLVFNLVIELRTQALEKQARELEKQKIKQEFIARIDDQYAQLQKLYQADEYEKAIEMIKLFNKYDQSDYRDLPKIKKEIRLFYLKKKLEFLPKIHLNEYMQLSKDIDIQEDDSTEVFIRQPRYGQYFYESDLPVIFEGIALSIIGDFSDQIVWTSDIDGELGKGRKISTRLSLGEHRITARSSNGMTTGQMTIPVFVEKDPDFLRHYQQN